MYPIFKALDIVLDIQKVSILQDKCPFTHSKGPPFIYQAIDHESLMGLLHLTTGVCSRKMNESGLTSQNGTGTNCTSRKLYIMHVTFL